VKNFEKTTISEDKKQENMSQVIIGLKVERLSSRMSRRHGQEILQADI
jgi:hypothetical protein